MKFQNELNTIWNETKVYKDLLYQRMSNKTSANNTYPNQTLFIN